ncbi:uncharacterized protein PHALS_11970 [Plasmopara halstedii]|uniref:Uncharacterized protein n=1 Tax=Plasmopara halstedii TaxID=4781 RepID=A0A0P1AKJ4_PLAHL|nr:uncharacterized protein PHALS_11970 [Plasmopara halstedii]CEG41637.1 hypothetical protein PHALS_11970 [Plasmopara halstedii]|eukprot:XP_024578006.1 hypothetical protein PHALS_11970 [Plasmopara halstedii]
MDGSYKVLICEQGIPLTPYWSDWLCPRITNMLLPHSIGWPYTYRLYLLSYLLSLPTTRKKSKWRNRSISWPLVTAGELGGARSSGARYDSKKGCNNLRLAFLYKTEAGQSVIRICQLLPNVHHELRYKVFHNQTVL